MGIKSSFESNPSQHSLGGVTPPIREGALTTSELHAQGIDPNKVMKPDHSIHDFDGLAPAVREGALNTSQLHAQGEDGSRTINPDHSIHDLDGISPSQTYTDIIMAEEAEGLNN